MPRLGKFFRGTLAKLGMYCISWTVPRGHRKRRTVWFGLYESIWEFTAYGLVGGGQV